MNISQETAFTESSTRMPCWPRQEPRREELGRHLARAYAEGQRAWPQLELPFERFRAHCERALGDAPPAGWHAHGADLYLCCACAEGSAAAHRLLRKELLVRVEAALRRAHSDEELVAESLHALDVAGLLRRRAEPDLQELQHHPEEPEFESGKTAREVVRDCNAVDGRFRRIRQGGHGGTGFNRGSGRRRRRRAAPSR